MVHAPRVEGSYPPPKPRSSADRIKKIRSANKGILRLVSKAKKGSLTAEAYRTERQLIIDHACEGDPLVFYAAWNYLLAEGALTPPKIHLGKSAIAGCQNIFGTGLNTFTTAGAGIQE